MDDTGNVISPEAVIHPSASLGCFNVIGRAKIGEDVIIENHCVIADDVEIEKGTRVRSFVELRPGTRIGEGCYIDSGVKSSGRNVIGDRVTLRFDAIIARGCNIGSDTYVCPQVMTNNLNHEGEEIGGAHVGPGSFIGTQTILDAGIQVSPRTVVGAAALVTSSIVEPGIYVGVPARKVRDLE